jgi:hypothetical protein
MEAMKPCSRSIVPSEPAVGVVDAGDEATRRMNLPGAALVVDFGAGPFEFGRVAFDHGERLPRLTFATAAAWPIAA